MGMFDSIIVEYPLSGLPQDLITRWGSDKEIVFQTKDTPNQYMSLYKIDADGKLWYEENETEWVDSINPGAESLFDRMGHMKIISQTWKQVDFNGSIRFYESYNHQNYKREYNEGESKEWQRYESGWVEYKALLKDGQLISIDQVEDKKPQELTEEELKVKREGWDAQRAEMKAKFAKSRKDHPSPEQKLIDQIYNTTVKFENFELYEVLVEDILSQIKSYREKTDIWYTNET